MATTDRPPNIPPPHNHHDGIKPRGSNCPACEEYWKKYGDKGHATRPM